jgi:hypothetical protein
MKYLSGCPFHCRCRGTIEAIEGAIDWGPDAADDSVENARPDATGFAPLSIDDSVPPPGGGTLIMFMLGPVFGSGIGVD